jgi:hypothetical protein
MRIIDGGGWGLIACTISTDNRLTAPPCLRIDLVCPVSIAFKGSACWGALPKSLRHQAPNQLDGGSEGRFAWLSLS